MTSLGPKALVKLASKFIGPQILPTPEPNSGAVMGLFSSPGKGIFRTSDTGFPSDAPAPWQ